MAKEMGEDGEVTDKDSLFVAKNLVWIAIYNISYIRGLFPERFFYDETIPKLDMRIKRLMPISNEARMLIEWIEKGMYHALRNRYLKTLSFCIWDEEKGLIVEEFSFSFSYTTKANEGIALHLTCKGSTKESAEFISNAAQVSTTKMRSSACNMIRILVSHMNTFDHIPKERTVLVKLLYNEDAPKDYVSAFIKSCAYNEAINTWNENPSKIEERELNSKNLVFTLKIKIVLYPFDDICANSDDKTMSLENGLDKDDVLSDIEVLPLEGDYYIVSSNEKAVINSEDFDGNLHVIEVGTDAEARDNMAREFDKLVQCSCVNNSSSQVMEKILSCPEDTVIEGASDENSMVNMQQGYLCCVSARKAEFFLDSGAVCHICRDRFCLQNFKKLPEREYVDLCSADGELFMAKHKGDLFYHNIRLHDVLFTRKVAFNVISVGELDKQGLMTCIGGGKFSIYNTQKSKVVAEGYLNRESNDYLCNTMNWCLPKQERYQKASVDREQHEEALQDGEEEEWVIDSLCARHMVYNMSLLSDVVSESLSFRTATGTIQTKRKGQISRGNIVLSEVLYCPMISVNLMSVAQLDKSGYLFTFYEGRCQIQRRDTLEE